MIIVKGICTISISLYGAVLEVGVVMYPLLDSVINTMRNQQAMLFGLVNSNDEFCAA